MRYRTRTRFAKRFPSRPSLQWTTTSTHSKIRSIVTLCSLRVSPPAEALEEVRRYQGCSDRTSEAFPLGSLSSRKTKHRFVDYYYYYIQHY